MWILKGSLLGILMFSILFAFRYHSKFYHVLIGPEVISQITIHNVFFRLGLVVCAAWVCDCWLLANQRYFLGALKGPREPLPLERFLQFCKGGIYVGIKCS
jgi:hypothetical protein